MTVDIPRTVASDEFEKANQLLTPDVDGDKGGSVSCGAYQDGDAQGN